MEQPPPQEPPQSPEEPTPDGRDLARKLSSARGPDRMILVAGVLFFIDSFLPWYGVKGVFSTIARSAGINPNLKGWDAGGLAVIAILFAIGATVFAGLKVAGVEVTGNEGLIALVLGGGAFLFALLRLLTETSFTRYGLYLAIVLGGVLAYGGYQKYQASKP